MMAWNAVRSVALMQLRRHWRALCFLALAVALAGGFLLTVAEGARRIDTAYPRFVNRARGPDVEVFLAEADKMYAELKARSEIESAALYSWMFVFPTSTKDHPTDGYVGLTDEFGTTVYTPIMVHGRAADQRRADEITINEAMAADTGLGVGDEVDLISGPELVHQHATIVGVHRGVRDFGSDAGARQALFTTAFGRLWRDAWVAHVAELRIGGDEPLPKAVAARVKPGTDVVALGSDLTARYGTEVTTDAQTSANTRDALGSQRTGYLLLAGIGGAGALLALLQAVSRQIRRNADELAALPALGCTPPERAAMTAMPVAAAALVGALGAMVLAWAASDRVPTGLAGKVDPDVSRHLGWTGAGVVEAGLVLTLLAGTIIVAVRDRRVRPERLTTSRRMAVIGRSASGLLGFRVAIGWGTRAGKAAARSLLLGVLVATITVTAVASWSASARHLEHSRRLWGYNWDANVGDAEDASVPQDSASVEARFNDVTARLLARRDLVSALARVDSGWSYELGAEVDGFTAQRGSIWPAATRGRMPESESEIAVGRELLRQHHWKVGAAITVNGNDFRIVGEAVAPQIGNGDFGGSVVATAAGFHRMDTRLNAGTFSFVTLAPGKTIADLEAVLPQSMTVQEEFTPSQVVNLAAIGRLDEVLVGFTALVGAIALIHGLRSAIRLRRRDHVVMRAIGSNRSVLVGSVGWQCVLNGAVAVFLGIPLGLIAGRLAWVHTATGLDVVTTPVSGLDVAIIACATIVVSLGVLTFALGAGAARRARTGTLRTE
jgi:hypothetical protein